MPSNFIGKNIRVLQTTVCKFIAQNLNAPNKSNRKKNRAFDVVPVPLAVPEIP